MAHTIEDIPRMLAEERAYRVGQHWSETKIAAHLAAYQDELRYQVGWPDCDRCGTPDSSVHYHARTQQNLCVFCREDVEE